MRQLEETHGEPIEDLLRRLYYTEGLSQLEVAEKLAVPVGTISGWFVRLGINQRALAAEHAAKELSA